MRTVAIAGVGLIGGSFAMALRAAGFDGRIVGVSSHGTIAKARAAGVIDAGVTLDEAAAEADLILLAQPITVIVDTLSQLRGKLKPGALVTDAGSTKRRIVEAGRAALGASFLGGHPMAGKESRGVDFAEAALFRGRPWLITPVEGHELDEINVQQFLVWLKRIGAHVIVGSPEDHDRWVARSSHLPQLVSTTLAATLDAREDREAILGAGGPGLASMTRLAMSSWPIWHDILQTNSDAIAEALREFRAELDATLTALDAQRLEQTFARGAEFAQKVRRNG